MPKTPDEGMNQSLSAAKTPRLTVPNLARAISPQASNKAAHTVAVDDAFDHEVAHKFAFIGAGQGGGRMAASFHALGYRRVCVFNTTDSDFEGLDDAIPRLSLNVGGARKDAMLALKQLEGRDAEVWDLMTRAWGNGTDYAIVCAGLGGGTGSGTCTRLVELARTYMESKGLEPKVGALVSLPPVTEGQRQCYNAVQSFKALLAAKVSPLIIIDNARIHELYSPAMSRLHPHANATISSLFHLFNVLAAVHSKHITFDKSELGQLLDSGVIVMGAADLPPGSIKSPADVAEAARVKLTDNVLATVDLSKGKVAACLFVGNADVLDNYSLDYFEAGFSALDRIVGSAYKGKGGVVVHRGLYEGDEPGLQAYVMVGGLEPPLGRFVELAKKGMVEQVTTTPKGVAHYFGVQD